MSGNSPVKINGHTVKNALGFFWSDGTYIYVAESWDDVKRFLDKGFAREQMWPMSEIETAYRNSDALRVISWCNPSRRNIVRQGASKVTFEYGAEKVIIETK